MAAVFGGADGGGGCGCGGGPSTNTGGGSAFGLRVSTTWRVQYLCVASARERDAWLAALRRCMRMPPAAPPRLPGGPGGPGGGGGGGGAAASDDIEPGLLEEEMEMKLMSADPRRCLCASLQVGIFTTIGIVQECCLTFLLLLAPR